MPGADYYTILGVSRDADDETIKKAYKKIAFDSHPDRNKGNPAAAERFKQATEAYEVLKNPDKRARYDRFGPDGAPGGGMAGEGFVDLGDALRAFMRDFGGLGGFGDVFGSTFESAGANAAHRGDDVEVRLDLTLEEVAIGVEKTITIPHLVSCATCAGSGARAGTKPQTCAQCRGTGRVRRVHSALFAQFVNVVACDRCRGEGRTIEDRCPDCRGEGRTRTTDSASVRIPAGVTSGTYVALRGLGDVGPRGGPPGDVLLLIEEKPHALFVRDGDDVLLDVCVTFSQAALGAALDVPTLDGTATIDIPNGIQSGTELKLRGKGLGRPRGSGRGDQRVRVMVWTPTKPTEKEKAALRELARVESQPPKPGRGFFSTVRDFFSREG